MKEENKMPYLWDDRLRVGIPEIDEQHRRLVAMMGDFHIAMKEGRSRQVQLEVVSGLIDYAKEHFATEERWFACYDYPNTERHKQRHQEFIARVIAFKDKIELGQLGVGIEISLFLSDWFYQHVHEEDQQYGHYFQERGITSSPISPSS
jgi:hemerythrin-like metal-binding protein